MSHQTVSVASTLNLSGTWNIRRYTNTRGVEKLRLERDHAVVQAVIGSGQAQQEGQDPVSPVSEDGQEEVRPDTADLDEGEPMEEEEFPDEEEEEGEEEGEGAEEVEGKSGGSEVDEEMADGNIKMEESDGDGDGEGDVENEDEREDGEDSEESEGGRAEQALAKAAQKASVKSKAPAKPPQQPGLKSAGGKGRVKHSWFYVNGPAKTIDQGLDNILSVRDDAPNGRLLRRSSQAPSTTSNGHNTGHMPPPATTQGTPSDVSKTPARKRKRDSFAE